MSNISYSQYVTYKECQYKFKLLYIDKIKTAPGNIHLIFGSALHETLQKYLEILYNESIKKSDGFDFSTFLQNSMINNFKKCGENIKDYVTVDEMSEYYNDGLEILMWFKKHRADYFIKKNYELVGCEVELLSKISENLNFHGYIDIVIKDIINNKYTIIDFKKSYRGWSENQTKSDNKRLQLQLYKYYYSKQFNVPLENIDVEFMIFKQKIFINDSLQYAPKRIQRVYPPSSERTLKNVIKSFNDDIEIIFNKDGSYNQNLTFNKNNKNCKYCPLLNNHCDGKNG